MDKYIILRAKDLNTLALLVNTAIDAGYVPQSGPVKPAWGGVYQAMVLREETPAQVGPTQIKHRSKND